LRKLFRTGKNYLKPVVILTGMMKKNLCGQTDIAEFAGFPVEEGVQLALKGKTSYCRKPKK
jgi:hypothetical protein